MVDQRYDKRTLAKLKNKITEIQHYINEIIDHKESRGVIKIKYLNTQLMTLVRKLEKSHQEDPK